MKMQFSESRPFTHTWNNTSQSWEREEIMSVIGLDFETYSATDLPKHGLKRYIADPYFKVLMAAVAVEGEETFVYDFINKPDHEQRFIAYMENLLEVGGTKIVAHNAGFEREVLAYLGIDTEPSDFIDSAVVARASGAGSKLEAAAPQLLGIDKLDEDGYLVTTFCTVAQWRRNAAESSGDYDKWLSFHEYTGMAEPESGRIIDGSLWKKFKEYCVRDAELGLQLYLACGIDAMEQKYSELTMEMNAVGWPVDMDLVRAMNEKYRDNKKRLLHDFHDLVIMEKEFNPNSHPQKVKFCTDRGVKLKKFDEKAVRKAIPRVKKKYEAESDPTKRLGYFEVLRMLQLLSALGGSSLSKLDKLEATVAENSRLYGSYLHIGAQATRRTTAMGVQMQNLPRLHGNGDDIGQVDLWSNDMLAHNLRQVFAAPGDGQIIVGDFSSVESRGLAYMAGEQWKLDAYTAGADIYKLLAQKKFGGDIEDITKDQRMFGKVGELACQYGAGGGAVKEFAENMGVTLTEVEAADLVRGWRRANPKIVEFWKVLDNMIATAMSVGAAQHTMDNMSIALARVPAPSSLTKQTNVRWSLSFGMTVNTNAKDNIRVHREIHGVHRNANGWGYYKPSSNKTGDLWKKDFTNPKTGQRQDYSLYGGKMSGLMTQSLCRELFFHVLKSVMFVIREVSNINVIGQFHDEIVMEWQPGPSALNAVMNMLHVEMSKERITGFPMAAEVHSAKRYIK